MLAPIFHEFCRILNWFCLLCKILRHKNINYEKCSYLIGASILGWFLGGFGWFLLVEDNFGWFQVDCCFSSYTNFTTYKKKVNSLSYSLPYHTEQSENKWLFPILYCVFCQIKNFFEENFLWTNSNKTQDCKIFKTRSFGGECQKNFQKHGDYLHSRWSGRKWTEMARSPRRMERNGRSVE